MDRDDLLDQCDDCDAVFEADEADCPACAGSPSGASSQPRGEQLSSTKLGRVLESGGQSLSAQKVNLLLAELGWIEKGAKGWKLTSQGARLGAQQLHARGSGVPYVVWPAEITANSALQRSVRELVGDDVPPQNSSEPIVVEPTAAEVVAAGNLPDFRTKFPAKFQTTDGHRVRSRGELLIDNWLYAQGLVHAYERRLPIADEVYCDFYLPQGRVYIEYWGLENQPKYAARMEEKKAIYAQHEFRLISLTDDHISALDDTLPALLLQYEIVTH